MSLAALLGVLAPITRSSRSGKGGKPRSPLEAETELGIWPPLRRLETIGWYGCESERFDASDKLADSVTRMFIETRSPI